MKKTINGKGIAAIKDAMAFNKKVFSQGIAKNSLTFKTYFTRPPIDLYRWLLVIAVIISFLIPAKQVHAQQSDGYLLKKNQFRVGLGANYIKTVDFQYSPNMFQSVRKSVQLGYSNRWKKGIFSTNLNVFLGTLTPGSGSGLNFYIKETDIHGAETVELKELEFTQMGFNLEIGYLHELSKLATTRTALYLGGSLEENLTYTPGFLNIGNINHGSLNAKARFDYLLGNGKPIIFGLSVPVVSVVTRMPYHNAPNIPGKSGLAGFFMDNNRVETLNHFQNARLSVKYNWLVRKRVAFDVTYDASWMHYFKPEHLTQMGSQLSLGLNF